jgi:hypothetical protein
MSIAEIERFAADLKSKPALRAEADKAQADKSHATPIDRAVAFAATKGYAFTAEQAKEHVKAKVKAKAKAAGKELTDAELDGVVGGLTLMVAPTPVGVSIDHAN